jgi:hypothetical protein
MLRENDLLSITIFMKITSFETPCICRYDYYFIHQDPTNFEHFLKTKNHLTIRSKVVSCFTLHSTFTGGKDLFEALILPFLPNDHV